MALEDWKRNTSSNFVARWDKGSTEIHIIKQSDYHGRGDRIYLVEGSSSVGGYFGVGETYAKTKTEAMKIARKYMRSH